MEHEIYFTDREIKELYNLVSDTVNRMGRDLTAREVILFDILAKLVLRVDFGIIDVYETDMRGGKIKD